MTSPTPATPADGTTKTIGEVLEHLRQEFPDISPSKLRFLEDQGLVTPDRTRAGYRTYSEEHLERLFFVLRAQRDQYLPLRVIREQLDALDQAAPLRVQGLRVSTGRGRAPAPMGSDRSHGKPGYSAAELAVEAQVPSRVVADAQEYGLINPGIQGRFDATAVDVVRAVGQLAEFGLESRHLRAFRASAEREMGLVEQVVAPLRHLRTDDSQVYVKDTARNVASLCLTLHAALLRSSLDRESW